MKNNNKINTVDAKNRLNEVIAQACASHIPIIVEKRGKPVAVIMDYESFEKKGEVTQESEASSLLQELHTFHRLINRNYPQGTGDAVDLLRQAREERIQR